MSDYYRAEDVALEVLAGGEHLEVRDNLTILSPSYPTDTAIIFYPGAKVEAAAYLPLLNQLRQTGLTCILVEMPFHLAIFDVNAAEDVMAQFPDIRHWYIAGHSMGGAMASQFASEHPDEVDGLILLGAYLYGDYPPADPSFARPARWRGSTLGNGYGPEAVQAVIDGTAPVRTPATGSARPAPRRLNLIIDIQQRMAQGKGPGYERWAKIYNLKQMAAALQFLQSCILT